MILLCASSEPGVLERLKGTLERAGIACEIRNELLSGLVPEIPISESMPELWIVNDERLSEAQQVLAGLKETVIASGTPWTCQQCGEILDPQFTSCWKCGSTR